MENFQDIFTSVSDLIVAYGGKLLLAIITLIVGFWVIRVIVKTFQKVMTKREVDPSLQSFLKPLVSILLKIMLVISVASMIGIAMTSLVAILAAAGLAVGLALSGTMQNFAGGVMLLIFKPFKVGDFIDAQGYSGSVKEMQIFNTILNTPDNKIIIIPNGGLSNGPMTNYSTMPTRRVDFTFGIGYEDDIEKAKLSLEKIVTADKRILKDPEHFIGVSELADSSVNFAVRVWVNSSDYWNVFFDITEKVKKTFDVDGLSIPYPQTDVHLFNENK
ncbi:MAG: mechanosensitive ion channel [Bacteroidales bacterium]|nr:mechanosensitive ion channel [Bacteroidales bacterium]